MARISNKNGKLTKGYRDPSVYHAPSRRGRKKSIWSSSPKRRGSRSTSQYSNQELTPKGCLTAALVIGFVVLMIVLMATLSKNTSNPPSTNDGAQSTEQQDNSTIKEVDLTSFEGEPAIEASIDIEKEIDSWVLEVNTHVKNNTGKGIKEITLYLICCHEDATPSDSWKYADRLTIKDIANNQNKNTEWTLGTTTSGKKEFICYIGYILYEDGTTWGTETIDHNTVITRDERISVDFKEVEKFSWKK